MRPTSISADGRFVAFDSSASNLGGGDTNTWGDVFVHDRDTGRATRIPDSERASTLAFPDFVGDDAVLGVAPADRRHHRRLALAVGLGDVVVHALELAQIEKRAHFANIIDLRVAFIESGDEGSGTRH